jgi:hypothetical protein
MVVHKGGKGAVAKNFKLFEMGLQVSMIKKPQKNHLF